MKLPYTPLQHAVRHAEEDGPLAKTLAGMPVVCCSLHSQLAPVCAGLGSELRTAYLQLPGGALPVALSDTVRALKRRELVAIAIAVGACIDGDEHAVTAAAALAWAAAAGFDAAVCAIGPGIVGTATSLGHGGLAAAEAANAAAALGGRTVIAVRVSDADARARHRGASHHTQAILRLCLGPADVAWPAGAQPPEWLADRQEIDVAGWEEACAELPLSHMGRGPAEDPSFFASAFAAGKLARSLAG
jgi:hypothetical protein